MGTRIVRAMLSIMLVSASVTGQAHAPVKDTSIADGAVLETTPSVFTVRFAGNVGLAAITIAPVEGEPLPLDYTTPKSMQDEFDIPLPVLAAGAYVITWRTMSADGHVMTGNVRFTVR